METSLGMLGPHLDPSFLFFPLKKLQTIKSFPKSWKYPWISSHVRSPNPGNSQPDPQGIMEFS